LAITYFNFTAVCASERVLKIGEYLMKCRKVKGLDIYIPPLTGKPRPAAVYN